MSHTDPRPHCGASADQGPSVGVGTEVSSKWILGGWISRCSHTKETPYLRSSQSGQLLHLPLCWGYYSIYINLNGNHVFFPDVCACMRVCEHVCVYVHFLSSTDLVTYNVDNISETV